MLFGLRALSGIGAGGINSLTMVIVSDIVTLRERGKYQGYLELMLALGNGLGPLIGGALSQHASWRWTFRLVVPLAGIAAAVVAWLLPQTRVDGSWREKVALIDGWGVSTSIAAVVLLLIPISGGGTTYPWSSPTVIALLVVGGILAVAFGVIEVAGWPRLPIMPRRLFAKPAARILFTHNFLTGFVYYLSMYFTPVYFQSVRGYSPLISGALVLPLLLGFSAGSTTAGLLIARKGTTNFAIRGGYILWTAGAAARIGWTRETHLAIVAVCLVIEGVGIGFVFQPTLMALQANTEKPDRAVATALRNFIRTIGGACGLAVGTAIINNTLLANLPRDVTEEDALGFPAGIDGMNDGMIHGIREGYWEGVWRVFVIGGPVIGVCLLTSFLVKDVKLAGGPTVTKKDEESKAEAEDGVPDDDEDGEATAVGTPVEGSVDEKKDGVHDAGEGRPGAVAREVMTGPEADRIRAVGGVPPPVQVGAPLPG